MVEIPERSILPTQGGGGASLPSLFFSSWIFVPRSTIWTCETGYTKGHEKNWAVKVFPLPFKQQRSDDALQCSDDHVKWQSNL